MITRQVGDILFGGGDDRDWRIERILRGGMGVVFVISATDDASEILAVKTFLEQSPQVEARFQQEAEVWINLDIHQNVTQARYVRKVEGRLYLFLEYVSGGDLSRWIGQPRLIEDLPQILRFGIQFCDGMIHAEQKGLKVHRDIKPQNCLITPDRVLKVTDFGLAKVFDDADFEPESGSEENDHRLSLVHTRTGRAAGTPAYMAPEQFDDAKRVDVRADIYAFGVMLFEMITGQLPFVGISWQQFEHLHRTQLPPTHVIEHDSLRGIIELCLAKEKARRFSDFGLMRESLATI